MKRKKENNFGIGLEIVAIYLAWLAENQDFEKIFELKELRKKIYHGDSKILEQVLQLGKSLKEYAQNYKNYSISNDETNFSKMYNDSKKYILNNNTTYEIPTAIILGGQQGSGKTGIVIKSVKEFEKNGQDVIELDLDSYRGFYKNCFRRILENPQSYAETINKTAGKIMEKLTNEIINKKFNFIFEGTLGKSAYTLDLLLNSKNNYNVKVKILSVCREESIFSNFERYIEINENISIGRLTTISNHDKTYEMFTERIKKIDESKVHVEVYTRGHNIYNPLKIYETGASNNKYKNAYQALIAGREESYIEFLKSYKKRLRKINDNSYIFRKNKSTYNELQKLNEIFNFK